MADTCDDHPTAERAPQTCPKDYPFSLNGGHSCCTVEPVDGKCPPFGSRSCRMRIPNVFTCADHPSAVRGKKDVEIESGEGLKFKIIMLNLNELLRTEFKIFFNSFF